MNQLAPVSYYSSTCKHYVLPVQAQQVPTLEEISDNFELYRKFRLSDSALENSIFKAQKGRYSHLKVPLTSREDPGLENIYTRATNANLKLCFQLFSAHPEGFNKVIQWHQHHPDHSYEVEVFINNFDDKVAELVSRIDAVKIHFSLVATKSTDWLAIGKAIRQLKPKVIHYYGPYDTNSENNLACKRQQQTLAKLKRWTKDVEFQPPLGTDLFDRRVKPNFDLEPFQPPTFEVKSQSPRIEYSIIIPSYNNAVHLSKMLQFVLKQTLSSDLFEVLIVDDGSEDGSLHRIQQVLRHHDSPVNLKYFYFPRKEARKMGDSQFRAGVARNLGAKHAQGRYYCFLDSDIIIPANYLETVGEHLKDYDGLQARRRNLKARKSYQDFQYDDILIGKDTFKDEAYWESFIEDRSAWNDRPQAWKYVCTHSFSIKAEAYWALGGIKKNFIFYGFEDTDLGYRLQKAGGRLHLLDTNVFHLIHEHERSEFKNLSSLRHVILSRTAQIFYLHHLDDEIFHTLRSYMEPEFRWAKVAVQCRQALTQLFQPHPVDVLQSLK